MISNRPDARQSEGAAAEPEEGWYRRAEERWRTQLRPERALGKLEPFVFKLAAIRRRLAPELQRVCCLVFVADHGVAFRGVSALSPNVTSELLASVSRGGTAANIFAACFGVDLRVIDVGSRFEGVSPKEVIDYRVRRGTRDIVSEAALTVEEVEAAFTAGRLATSQAIEQGAEALAIGEIGIGNTTIAGALASRLLSLPVLETVGPGTGVSGEVLERKRSLVRAALARVGDRHLEPREMIAELGGLEVAALVGAVLECVERRVPLVLDGYLTCVSALLAARSGAKVQSVGFGSHLTREPGHSRVLHELGLEPLLTLEFNLGEGTGAIIGLAFLVLGSRLLAKLACFDDLVPAV